MDLQKLKPPLAFSIVILFLAIMVSLHLMSSATQDASQLGRMYSTLVSVNALGTLVLLGLVVANAYGLLRQLRKRTAGSNLTARMMFLFSLLTLVPASIVFYYSVKFLEQSIDSWFDVRIDRAMEDALKLGQAALDERMSSLLRQTEMVASDLANSPVSLLAIRLGEIRENAEDAEMTIFSRQGRIIAFSGNQTGTIIPELPEIGILLQVRQGRSYVGLDSAVTNSLQIRVVVAMAGEEGLFLQAIYPVPLRLTQLAETVESAYVHYKEMTFLRGSLKLTFGLTLSLVLLLSLLAAIWAAFLSIRQIVAPVRHLARGTRAVAEGNYEKRLPIKRRDELGFLVESFNAMTEKIAQARDQAQKSQQEVERQRAYLEILLGNLSSGVLSFDGNLRLQMANQSADSMLHAEFGRYVGQLVPGIVADYNHLAEPLGLIESHLLKGEASWQEEMPFPGPAGRQELFCRGSPLLGPEGERQGVVVVIDDLTALIQAQRVAAWSEVARRLAHEIKNPLTPIQLSAERLRHKLHKSLEPADAEILDKSTRTIVQQVEAMKTMVNAFAEYAKPSTIQFQKLNIGNLIEEVVALYPPQSGLEFRVELDRKLPLVSADPIKLRQVFHNLFKNSQEAMPADEAGRITITSGLIEESHHDFVEIRICDTGPGIPADQVDRVFEPYVTTKARGTGLGLAIVKKIVEEHGGNIRLMSGNQEGTTVVIRLPIVSISKQQAVEV